jgi:hypothetical protein
MEIRKYSCISISRILLLVFLSCKKKEIDALVEIPEICVTGHGRTVLTGKLKSYITSYRATLEKLLPYV